MDVLRAWSPHLIVEVSHGVLVEVFLGVPLKTSQTSSTWGQSIIHARLVPFTQRSMSSGQNQKSVTISLLPPYWVFLPQYAGAGVPLEPLAIRAVHLTLVAICWAWHLQLDLYKILAMCHCDMLQSDSNAIVTWSSSSLSAPATNAPTHSVWVVLDLVCTQGYEKLTLSGLWESPSSPSRRSNFCFVLPKISSPSRCRIWVVATSTPGSWLSA
jgi:hypothetical protein